VQRLHKLINEIDEDKKSDLFKEVEKYFELEKIVVNHRIQMIRELEKAKTIYDRDERLAYMENFRKNRDKKREKELAARDIAIAKFNEIEEKVQRHRRDKKEL
jgi:hypothetical protein